MLVDEPLTAARTVPAGRPRISIICPVFNEAQTIPIFYDRISAVLQPLRDRYDFELLFLNNRSSDGTLEVLKDLRRRDASVQIITLSRNFGYQASVQAGMSYASGDGIIVIDVDCEDPPELIPAFLAKWQEGYDVVCGIRMERAERWVVKKLRNVFYHLLRLTADMDIVLYMAEFALISAVVRDAILNNKNTFPFLRAEIGYAGFSRYEFAYNRQARVAGRTHYNFLRMLSFAAAGLLTSSTFLMRLAAYLLPVVIALNALLVVSDHPLAFRALVASDLSYIALLITIQGVYLARVYKNAMGRPIFIVDPRHTYLDSVHAAGRVPVAKEYV